MIRALALFLGLVLAVPALAPSALAPPALAGVTPTEMLQDPTLEARARELGQELRCLVCQNQSIDDSDADLARDLRHVVRERLVAGDSNQAVKDYLVARYGPFVLLKPPVETSTYLLWVGPLILLVLGALVVVLFLRRKSGAMAEPAPLSADELSRLERLGE